MKDVVGSPGTKTGLMLRIGQCGFAAASIAFMVCAAGFASYTAFCYLIASMGLQVLWSFGLACLDVYALKIKRDLQSPVLVSLFVVGDWVTASPPLKLPYTKIVQHQLLNLGFIVNLIVSVFNLGSF